MCVRLYFVCFIWLMYTWKIGTMVYLKIPWYISNVTWHIKVPWTCTIVHLKCTMVHFKCTVIHRNVSWYILNVPWCIKVPWKCTMKHYKWCPQDCSFTDHFKASSCWIKDSPVGFWGLLELESLFHCHVCSSL